MTSKAVLLNSTLVSCMNGRTAGWADHCVNTRKSIQVVGDGDGRHLHYVVKYSRSLKFKL
jgi:hypothetical protein